MASKQEVKNLFDKYKKIKHDELSILNPNGKIIPADISIFTDEDSKHISFVDGMTIFNDELVEKFSPDNIDINYFWKQAVRVFPINSIGKVSKKKVYPFEFNKLILEGLHNKLHGTEFLDSFMIANPNAKMLEIGPGYGVIKEYMKNKYKNLINYHAVDVNLLFKFSRLYKGDGKNIPSTIPYPLDLVYSVNVFQHLSEAQRNSYYKQIGIILRPGGEFICSQFIITAETAKIKTPNGNPLFGLRGKRGEYFGGFYNQFTKISIIDELYKELEKNDLILQKNAKITSNTITFRAVKQKEKTFSFNL